MGKQLEWNVMKKKTDFENIGVKCNPLTGTSFSWKFAGEVKTT